MKWFLIYITCTGISPTCTSIVIPFGFKTEGVCNLVAQREIFRFRENTTTYLCLNTATNVYQ